jgi:hypothetical protein
MSKITMSKTSIEVNGITYNWVIFDDLADDQQNAIIKEVVQDGEILKTELRDTDFGQIMLLFVRFMNGYITRLVPTEMTSGHKDMESLMESIDWDTDNLHKLEGKSINYIPVIAIDGKTKQQRKTEDGKRIITFRLKSLIAGKESPKTESFGKTDFDTIECGICHTAIPKKAFKDHIAKHNL